MEELENHIFEQAGDIFQGGIVKPAVSGQSKIESTICYGIVAGFCLYRLWKNVKIFFVPSE